MLGLGIDLFQRGAGSADVPQLFNAVTYTGNGTSQAITGVGFQPDFVWIKQRNFTASHQLQDSVRGTGKILFSNDTSAEVSHNTITSFDSDGFTAAVDGVATGTNAFGGTYVAWCWKAGGTAVTNTDGAITSQVSANVDAGFSIVGYTATNSSSNVGHGLSQAPELIISKRRTGTSSWMAYTTVVDGSYDYLLLNNTNAKSNSVLSAPTSSLFYVNNTEAAATNIGTDTYITYCFHSVEGFSKFGSYVGNGSADGPFVYTGFKPAFVMIKCTDTNANGHWIMKDNLRAADYNPASGNLYANLNYAEDTTASLNVDLLANGFKIKGDYAGINASGANFIYMAIKGVD